MAGRAASPAKKPTSAPRSGPPTKPAETAQQQEHVARRAGDADLGEDALLEHGGGDQDERHATTASPSILHDGPAGQMTTLT